MARIELAPEVFDDFDRFFDQLTPFECDDVPLRIGDIVQALQILAHSPTGLAPDRSLHPHREHSAR